MWDAAQQLEKLSFRDSRVSTNRQSRRQRHGGGAAKNSVKGVVWREQAASSPVDIQVGAEHCVWDGSWELASQGGG